MLSPEIEKGTFFVTPCRDDEEEVDNDGDGGDSGARTFWNNREGDGYHKEGAIDDVDDGGKVMKDYDCDADYDFLDKI